MKFLFVGQGYPQVEGTTSGSGVGTYVYEICQGLLARGHSCDVIVWQEGPGSPPSRQNIEGVTVHLLTHSYWPIIEKLAPESREVSTLRHLVQRLNADQAYDWIEIQSEEGIAIGCQKDFPQQVILRVHTTLAQMIQFKQIPIGWRERYRLHRERRSFTIARWVVTHSHAHAESLRKDYQIQGEIYVVPHGIGIPTSYSLSKAIPTKKPTVLIIGTADLRKGIDRVRPVMEAFAQTGEEVCFRVITSNPQKTARLLSADQGWPRGIEVQIDSGLSPEEMEWAYRSADVVFHPARYESFGLTCIEPARYGTPLVATNVGIVPDLLTGELTRYIVDGDRPNECAKALENAIADREKLGTLLRARYEAEFTRDRMIDNYLSILHSFASR